MQPPQLYLTLSLRGLGFDTFQSNLLAIPWTVLHSKSLPTKSKPSNTKESKSHHHAIPNLLRRDLQRANLPRCLGAVLGNPILGLPLRHGYCARKQVDCLGGDYPALIIPKW